MKNKIIFLVFLFIFFAFPSTINAICTDNEKIEFNKVSDGYKATYEFNNDTKNYNLTFYKPSDKFSVVTYAKEINDCSSVIGGTFTCYNIPAGEYTVDIIGRTDTCDDVVKTFKVVLPKYNEYASSELCMGIEEFVLCQPTYDKEIDYDTFVSRVNIYKKTKEEQEEVKNSNKNSKITEIVSYVEDNLTSFIIVIVFIIAVVVTVILTIRNANRSRRLE